MLHLFYAPLCIFAIPFFVSIWIECSWGSSQHLTLHLFNTLQWAFLTELMHSALLLARTHAYYRFLRNMMWYRRFIWHFLGRPVGDPEAWNLDRWERFGFPQHEDPDRWHEGHPVVKTIIFFMKMVQIHVEGKLLSGVHNWMGDMLIPPIGIKAEYLPDFLQGRPIYDSSLSLWLRQVSERVSLDIILSVCLLGVAQIFSVYIHTLSDALDEDGWRTWDVNDAYSRRFSALISIFQDMSMSILQRAAYQALFPLYLIVRPLCNPLRILPYVSPQSFVNLINLGSFRIFVKYLFRYLFEGYRYKLSEYAFTDTIAVWEYQYSIWVFLLTSLFVVPFVVFLVRVPWQVLFSILYHTLCTLDRDFLGPLYLPGYLVADMIAVELLPIFDPNQGPRHLLFRNATPVPRLYQYEGIFAGLAPDERVLQARGRQHFLEDLGLYW
ncbi:hypothetical protein PGQ11_014538 [Apiospora arundinis]|uniref:Uncharacterized protein n=1 Tax=Apiospora arundinis TaxID=335852 RepID=A0ABR2HSL4_9PEZI